MKFSKEEVDILVNLLGTEQANIQWSLKQDRIWGKYHNVDKMERELPTIEKLYSRFEIEEKKSK